jgi:hypothetical protein
MFMKQQVQLKISLVKRFFPIRATTEFRDAV